jgi:hypothetical protein
MTRKTIACLALIAAVLIPCEVGATRPDRDGQAAAQMTAADAAPFIGAWALALNGQNGAQAMDLTVKVDKEKVVAEITIAGMPAQAITDVTKADKSLILRYSFDYQGQPIPAVVTLTPGAEGKTNAQVDFAGGAYVLTGTAAKKTDK